MSDSATEVPKEPEKPEGKADHRTAWIAAGAGVAGALVGGIISLVATDMQLDRTASTRAQDLRADAYVEYVSTTQDQLSLMETSASLLALRCIGGIAEGEREELQAMFDETFTMERLLESRQAESRAAAKLVLLGSEEANAAAGRVSESLAQASGHFQLTSAGDICDRAGTASEPVNLILEALGEFGDVGKEDLGLSD